MMNATPLHTVDEIRRIESAALASLPAGTLMARAGAAATRTALRLLGDPSIGAKVLVLAGPGNNGGDALDAAARLVQAGWRVDILLFADPDSMPADARAAYARAKASPACFLAQVSSGVPFDATRLTAETWSLVIDGLFGIGLARPLAGALRATVETVNSLPCPVLALDVPSGLNADTGAVVGPKGVAIRATHTLSFLADKPGLHTGAGRDHAGEVEVASLDIHDSSQAQAHAWLTGPEAFAPALRRRLHDSHKGSYGDLAVVGGANGMAGAPVLSATAAAYGGAGRVFIAFVGTPISYDSQHPELMCRSASELDVQHMNVLAGPGMGMSRDAHDALARSLSSSKAVVIDADGLNLLAEEPGLRDRLAHRRAPAILTPHPLEAARLLNMTTSEVQANRLAAARELAQRLRAIVALKGSGTVIADPDRRVAINPTGNPALATAGSGDVLAGFCGALLAQQWPAWEAALAAVWIHGAAADLLVAEGSGPIGLTAGELIPAIRTIHNRLTQEHAR